MKNETFFLRLKPDEADLWLRVRLLAVKLNCSYREIIIRALQKFLEEEE